MTPRDRRGVRWRFVLTELLFPPRCVGCGELLRPLDVERPVFCAMCRTAWEAASLREPMPSDRHQRASNSAEYRTAVALVTYRAGQTDGVPERMIYHLKHKDDRRAFDFVASRLARRVLAVCEPDGYAGERLLVTYPPRSPSAIRKDGFDQAARIARRLAVWCDGDFATLFRRTAGRRQEQKRLDALARVENAAQAYRPVPDLPRAVRGRVIVLVDDLRTTGATLDACTRYLHEAGAKAVIWATVGETASAGSEKR